MIYQCVMTEGKGIDSCIDATRLMRCMELKEEIIQVCKQCGVKAVCRPVACCAVGYRRYGEVGGGQASSVG